eukprot:1989530-Amphidinium_carterae.1
MQHKQHIKRHPNKLPRGGVHRGLQDARSMGADFRKIHEHCDCLTAGGSRCSALAVWQVALTEGEYDTNKSNCALQNIYMVARFGFHHYTRMTP